MFCLEFVNVAYFFFSLWYSTAALMKDAKRGLGDSTVLEYSG